MYLLIWIMLGSSALFSHVVAAETDHPILYLFWGDGCPHCEQEREFLYTLQEKFPALEMRWFETWNNNAFAQFADAMQKAYHLGTTSVPLTFIGTWSLIGYQDALSSGVEIERQIVACLQQGCPDAVNKVGPHAIVARIQAEVAQKKPVGWEWFPAAIPPRQNVPFPVKTSVQARNITSRQPQHSTPTPAAGTTLALPGLGNVEAEKFVEKIGLPLFTLVIAGLDGFNPCAMWVLCFLLTIVIYAKSRLKILLIGGIFVIASGVIYFLFMIAWLNMFMLVGYVNALRIGIALVAIVMGVINCKDFFFFKRGVSLTIPEAAQPKLFKRMRAIVHTSALPAMILGTLALAVTANLIELLCTAGFPAIYTRILTLHKLPVAQYYVYLALYNVIYVVPLAVIVGIFAWKMGGRKLTEKEGRLLKLVSGVLMLVLGLVLLLNPQLLMFG